MAKKKGKKEFFLDDVIELQEGKPAQPVMPIETPVEIKPEVEEETVETPKPVIVKVDDVLPQIPEPKEKKEPGSWTGTQGKKGETLPRRQIWILPEVKKVMMEYAEKFNMTYSQFVTMLALEYKDDFMLNCPTCRGKGKDELEVVNLRLHQETLDKMKNDAKKVRMSYADFTSMLILIYNERQK